MNSKLILENISETANSDDKELLKLVRQALIDYECACAYFDSVCDPNLVDYAIYNQKAAALYYSYLISELKKRRNKNSIAG